MCTKKTKYNMDKTQNDRGLMKESVTKIRILHGKVTDGILYVANSPNMGICPFTRRLVFPSFGTSP